MSAAASISSPTQQVLAYLKARKIPVKASNQVVIQQDDTCSMAAVAVNGKNIMEGNFWDFHPGCHGMALPDFRGQAALANLFIMALEAQGKTVQCTVDRDWRYEE